MPKNTEPITKLTNKTSEYNSEAIAQWPKLEFSTATGDSNIHQYIKSLEEAVAANFGVNYTSLMRTGRKWTPPTPTFTAVPKQHPNYLFQKDLRRALISNYANELQRAETVNQKLYGIIWITLSKESKFAIERLPEWSTPPTEAPTSPRQQPPQVQEPAADEPDEQGDQEEGAQSDAEEE